MTDADIETPAIRAACDEAYPTLPLRAACVYPECHCGRDGEEMRIARAVLAAVRGPIEEVERERIIRAACALSDRETERGDIERSDVLCELVAAIRTQGGGDGTRD